MGMITRRRARAQEDEDDLDKPIALLAREGCQSTQPAHADTSHQPSKKLRRTKPPVVKAAGSPKVGAIPTAPCCQLQLPSTIDVAAVQQSVDALTQGNIVDTNVSGVPEEVSKAMTIEASVAESTVVRTEQRAQYRTSRRLAAARTMTDSGAGKQPDAPRQRTKGQKAPVSGSGPPVDSAAADVRQPKPANLHASPLLEAQPTEPFCQPPPVPVETAPTYEGDQGSKEQPGVLPGPSPPPPPPPPPTSPARLAVILTATSSLGPPTAPASALATMVPISTSSHLPLPHLPACSALVDTAVGNAAAPTLPAVPTTGGSSPTGATGTPGPPGSAEPDAVSEAAAGGSPSVAAVNAVQATATGPRTGAAVGVAAAGGRSTSAAYRLYLQLTEVRPDSKWPEGSRVWVKMAGYCPWPAVVFPLRLCRKREVPDLLASYKPGTTLVHFYGSHNYSWASDASLNTWGGPHREERLAALRAHAKKSGTQMTANTLAELQGSTGANAALDPQRELARIVRLWKGQSRDAGGAGSGGEAAGRKGHGHHCHACGEDGTQVTCGRCHKSFHTLCVPEPEVSPAHILEAAAAAAAAAAVAAATGAGTMAGYDGAAAALAGTAGSARACMPGCPVAREAGEGVVEAPVDRPAWKCGNCGAKNEVKGRLPPVAPPPCAGGGAASGAKKPPASAAANGGTGAGAGAAASAATAMYLATAGGSAAGAAPFSAPGAPQHHYLGNPAASPRQQLHDSWMALYDHLIQLEQPAGAAAEGATALPPTIVGTTAVTAAAAAAAGTDVLSRWPCEVQGSSSQRSAGFGGQGGTPTAGLGGSATAAEVLQTQSRGGGGGSGSGNAGAVQSPARGAVAAGTRLWVKIPGYCPWPAVVFPLRLCRKREVPDLLANFVPGSTLVHFYGEHNHVWMPDQDVAELAASDPPDPDPAAQVQAERIAALESWSSSCKRGRGSASGLTALAEVRAAEKDAEAELARICRLRDAQLEALEEELEREQLQWEREADGYSAAAAGKGVTRPGTHTGAAAARQIAHGSAASSQLSSSSAATRAAPLRREGVAGGGGVGGGVAGDGGESEEGAGQGVWGWRRRLWVCSSCREAGGQVSCAHCRRAFHTLCLPRPSRFLSIVHMPSGHQWECGHCGRVNVHQPEARLPASHAAGRCREDVPGAENLERMGLTPDWIIYSAAFQVFQLPLPTVDMPYIRGLLDPCTNNKSRPNIPAEMLYDKQDDGLRLSNTWSGYYVILNPEYTSQTQWRFVNRAIDEVESGSVPAVVLVCRNSTDTAYFQRLRPYPRVMLRRTSTRFKDYAKTPIGFGVAVFCIARRGPARTGLYSRFIEAFADRGEPNIPIDAAFVASAEFEALLDRLADHTARHLRDNWVQCTACKKWRIVPYTMFQTIELDPTLAREWTCSRLGGGCERPQSRAEAVGVHYARQRNVAGGTSERHLIGLNVWHDAAAAAADGEEDPARTPEQPGSEMAAATANGEENPARTAEQPGSEMASAAANGEENPARTAEPGSVMAAAAADGDGSSGAQEPPPEPADEQEGFGRPPGPETESPEAAGQVLAGYGPGKEAVVGSEAEVMVVAVAVVAEVVGMAEA